MTLNDSNKATRGNGSDADSNKATRGNGSDAGATIEEEGSLQHRVDEILSMPFEQALQACDSLRVYIEGHEDAVALREEFRESWHLDAPADLRQVLEEVIDPEAFAAAAAFEVEAAAVRLVDLPLLPHGEPLMREAEQPVDLMHDEKMQLDHDETQAAKPTAIPVNHQPMDEDYDNDEAFSANHDRAKALLALPFDEALSQCGELQRYIQGADDGEALEREFQEHWHLDAPEALRDVLFELLEQQDEEKGTTRSKL